MISKDLSEFNNSRDLSLGSFSCHLLRVNKWTLLGNLFFIALRLTPHHEIKEYYEKYKLQ